jgi:hypothetical protein
MKYKNPFRYTPNVWLPPENYVHNEVLEEVKKLWKKNKIIPKHLEDIFYTVMSYYPELKETHLIVVETRFYALSILCEHTRLYYLYQTREKTAFILL